MLDPSLQGVAPCEDCPDGMTLNAVQKLRGKDSWQAQACTVGLRVI
jgi:hypothetical protein